VNNDNDDRGLPQRADQLAEENAWLRQQLAEREAQLTRLTASVAERKAEHARLAKALAERKAEQARLAKAVAQREAEQIRLAKALAERESEHARLAEAISRLETRARGREPAVTGPAPVPGPLPQRRYWPSRASILPTVPALYLIVMIAYLLQAGLIIFGDAARWTLLKLAGTLMGMIAVSAYLGAWRRRRRQTPDA